MRYEFRVLDGCGAAIEHFGRSRGGAWRGAVVEAATFRAGMGSRAPFIAAEIADRALERVHRAWGDSKL
jgi:hypothetical protein